MSEEKVYGGTVKWFDADRGYGFILGYDGVDIFVHYSGIEGDGYKALQMGDEVEYVEGSNNKGRCAERVRVTKSVKTPS